MTDLLDEVWVEEVLDEYHGSGLHGLRWAGGSTGPPEMSPIVPLLYWNSRGKDPLLESAVFECDA